MNLEKLHRDTADAIKAVKALKDGCGFMKIMGSDNGIDWSPLAGLRDYPFKYYKFYRLPKPERIFFLETGWVKNKESGNFYAVIPWEYGLYRVLDCNYKYEEMLKYFTPATLAEVQQAERDMRGEG